METAYSDKATYDDYVNLNTDKRYELIDGEFFEVPSPESFHQVVSKNIEYELIKYVEKMI